MKLDDVDDLLAEWGRWYGPRDRPSLDADGYPMPELSGWAGRHPLERAMESAPGRNADMALATLVRTRGRRLRMAEGLAACGVRIVPEAYVDPQAGTETRPHLGTPRWPTEPDPIPRDVQRVEGEVRRLVLAEPEWGYALRARYCQRGDADLKRAWLVEKIGRTVTKRAYFALIEQAKLVLLGRLGA